MQDVYIVGAARTPIGNFNGALAHVGAVELGKIATEESLKRAGLSVEDVDEVLMGCVCRPVWGRMSHVRF